MTLLFAWLWQGLAIALLVALGLRLAVRVNASTRHAIWWLACVAIVLLPFVQLVAMLSSTPAPPGPAAPPIASAQIVVPISNWAIAAAVVIWLSAAVAGWVRIAAGLRLLVRLQRQSRPLDAEREARLRMWMSVRDSGRRPALRVADVECAACALGLWRPTILISRRALHAFDDEELDQIVMHEHAHLLRFDDWSRLAQAIITTAAGVHPAVHFISRQIDLEREAACDDQVVTRTGAARRYAACLTEAAAIAAGSFRAAVVPGAIGSRSTLHARVGRLLDPGRDRSSRLSRPACGAALCVCAAVVIGSNEVRPVVLLLDAQVTVTDGIAALPAPDLRPPATGTDFDADAPATPGDAQVTAWQEGVIHHGLAATASSAAARDGGVASDPSPPPAAARRAPGAPIERIDGLPVPATPALDVRAADVTPALRGHRVEPAYDDLALPHVAQTSRTLAPPAASIADAPWDRVAGAGVALGDRAKRSGVAIGGFFSRTGQAIAKTF